MRRRGLVFQTLSKCLKKRLAAAPFRQSCTRMSSTTPCGCTLSYIDRHHAMSCQRLHWHALWFRRLNRLCRAYLVSCEHGGTLCSAVSSARNSTVATTCARFTVATVAPGTDVPRKCFD